MAIKVKGNIITGDSSSVIENVTTKTVYQKPITEDIHRQVPIKTYVSISKEKYQKVKDGELTKHYNKKSCYLADMIDNSIDLE
jgi:hypothetical protein